MKPGRTVRHVGYEVHAVHKTGVQRFHDDALDHSSRIVGEHRAHKVAADYRREADTLVAGYGYRHGTVVGVRRQRTLDIRLPGLYLHPAVNRAAVTEFLKGDDGAFRTVGHFVPGTEAGVFPVAQVVVHALVPVMGLIDEHVAFRAVQFCRRTVGILVAVRIVKLRDCHCSLDCLLAEHPVPLPQYGRHMRTRNILVAVLVTGLVVGVAHIRVVAHRVVKLNHRVLRLPDVQLVEALRIFVEGVVVQVFRQPVRADELAPRVRGVAGCVEAAQPGVIPLFQVAAVALKLQAGDAHVLQLAFQREQFLEHRQPVDEGAVLYPDAGKVTLVVKNYRTPLDILHGAQRKRLEVGRKVQPVYRRTLGEGDGAQRRAARRVHLLQPVAAGKVKPRQVRVVHNVQFPEHGQLRAQHEFGQGVCVAAVAQHQFFQHRQVRKAHVREAAPVRKVELLHPLAAVQVEDGADVRRLPVGVAPLIVLCHRVVRHRVALAPELEVEVTRRGGPHRRAGRAVALERYVRGGVLPGAVTRVEQAHAVRYPPVPVCLAVALHRFQVRVLHVRHATVVVHLHALRLGPHVLVLRVQVVDALAELRALLRVEHVEDGRVRHPFPDAHVGRRQLAGELLPQVLPKHAVVPGVGIDGLDLRRQFRVGGVLVHVPRVLQAAVIAHAEDGVAVVEYHVGERLVLVRVIPEGHHHVLHALVDAAHDVREHVVVAQVVHVKPVRKLRLELRPVVLRALHPLHQRLEVFRLPGSGLVLRVDVVVVREARLEHLQPVRRAVLALRVEVVVQEHAHRVVVVQELPAFGRVLPSELLRHPRLVMVAGYVEEAKHGLGALVVVEVELAQELRGFLQRTAVEQVARLAVNRRAHIIGVAAVAVPLRRGKLPGRRQDVLHQLGHTGVVRAGAFREVGLQAEAVHRRGLFPAAACRAEGVFRLFLQLAAHALLVTAEVQVAGHLRGVLEVDAVVLYRIGKRACALQADAAAHAAEVQRLAALHHAQHLVHVVLRVFVVVHRRLQHRGHAVVLPSGDDDVPHAVRHAVDRHVAAVVDHVVAVVQGHHAVRAVLVYHVGLKHLRVAQVRVVGTHEVHVGGRAVRAKPDVRRRGLVHAVARRPLHASGHDAVDVQVHHLRVQLLVVGRAVRALGEAHEGHLVHFSGRHLH